MINEHQPVLLNEVMKGLNIKPNGIYIDGTFGRGGHAKAILDQLSNEGRLIAIDQDPEAITIGLKRFGDDSRFKIVHASFAAVEKIANTLDLIAKVDGILLDLGVSSPQLDDATRGFSFMREGPLDMRMDNTQGESAADWINHAAEKEISFVLKTYGEESFSKRIANAIVNARQVKAITTTKELAAIIAKAIPKHEKHKHPATRSFQAIRIFINRELEALQLFLEQSLTVLKIGGRIAIITFHSLEDRLVKEFIVKQERDEAFPADFPVRQEELKPRIKKIGKAVKPSDEEIGKNVRARSAKLRVMEKLR